MEAVFKGFRIQDWQPRDRAAAATVIRTVLTEYGLPWEPTGADRDVLAVEDCYLATGGEFWVIYQGSQLVGTGAYYPIDRGDRAVEIRKMYLLPLARGQGLGRWLLQQLEQAAARRGFQIAWLETASVLATAVQLYETSGYQLTQGVETPRCDRLYCKPIARESITAHQPSATNSISKNLYTNS
ncbi:GNAT family N-acetyltransferase [Limnothrix sp. FACHB-1083]|uniref:GNAT family N-acetyltransferase n=1 Tax=unclassified Limnothrix TaxID=2632864 RepID=UPI0016803B96|nr:MULTISPECIES: GNAT family N-acetyltransferase [unclassified Limnothrix]MBD2159805.1 GNAT family N-acetyltransferase [Limnothrix sp. FACHB-1083]MBD2190507.1 GNAT family N-acetyltransferase [Limnothrix sp. FACHB-1088]